MPVRGKTAVMRLRQRQGFRKTPVNRHEEKPAAEGARAIVARRVEQDISAVGRPADDTIDSGMIRQAPGHAANR